MGAPLIGPAGASIDGVQIIPLQQMIDQRGAVYHMMKSTDAVFRQFGEVYFSLINPAVVKAWKNHQRVVINLVCIYGRVRLVLHDQRAASPTRGVTLEIVLGPEHYGLVVVPPGVWNGFQGLATPHSIVCNCATEPTNPTEYERIEFTSPRIPYVWRSEAAS